MASAAIFDCEGARLTPDERAFFRDADPFGFILFARHCSSETAVRYLCSELRDCVGRADAPILIDQEGGRVQRMRPPAFASHPPMGAFGALHKLDPRKAIEAAELNAYLLGRMVSDLGVTVNCLPMLDVRQLDADLVVIGDRAAASHPDTVAAIGRAVMNGLARGGALPVIKHLPGHGRATCDSHYALPRVVARADELRSVDFPPFKALRDAPFGMTAHVVFEALDPDQCATLSATVITEIIRGEIGFEGFLFSDDLKMQALGGPLATRAGAAIAAGCDAALCCNFTLAEKIDAAAHIPPLEGPSLSRAVAALAQAPGGVQRGDTTADYDRLATLMKPVLVA